MVATSHFSPDEYVTVRDSKVRDSIVRDSTMIAQWSDTHKLTVGALQRYVRTRAASLPPSDPAALPYTYPFRDVEEIIACGDQTASRIDIQSFWEFASDDLIGHIGDIAFAGVPYDQWHETEHFAKFEYMWKIRDMCR